MSENLDQSEREERTVRVPTCHKSRARRALSRMPPPVDVTND